MSVRIVIGSSERNIRNIHPNWIDEQVNRRRDEGVPVCVRIFIEENDINISLKTKDCRNSGGIARTLTNSENEVVSLWNKLNLSESDFSSSNLITFLKQLST